MAIYTYRKDKRCNYYDNENIYIYKDGRLKQPISVLTVYICLLKSYIFTKKPVILLSILVFVQISN